MTNPTNKARRAAPHRFEFERIEPHRPEDRDEPCPARAWKDTSLERMPMSRTDLVRQRNANPSGSYRSDRLSLIEACNQLHPHTPYEFDSCVTNPEMYGELLSAGVWVG